MLAGNIQYNGQNLQLQGSAGSIQLQAYQSGYELKSPITIYVNQDGRFSARLFNGHYKIVTKENAHELNPQAVVEKLGLPLMVKPSLEGSSVGLTKVKAVNTMPCKIL